MKLTKEPLRNQALLAGLFFAFLNLILRSICLNGNDIALDEPFTLYWANQSVGDILRLSLNENNPPLPFLLQHFWMLIMGLEDQVQRIPALIFGVATVYVAVSFIVKRTSLYAGVILGLLLTFSNEHMFYSHELRAYSLLTFLSLLAFVFTSIQAEKQNSSAPLYYLSLVSIALIYTHYLSVFVILASSMSILVFSNGISRLKQFIAPALVFIVGVSPLLYSFFARLSHVSQTGTWVPEPHWTQLYGHLIILLNSSANFLILFLIILAYFVAFSWRNELKSRLKKLFTNNIFKYGALWFLVVYLGLYLQSLIFQPVFIPRYIFFSSIFLFLCIAIIFNEFATDTRKKNFILLVFFIPYTFAFELNPSNHREMKELIRVVENRVDESAVVICPSSFELAYAFHADKELFYSNGDLRTQLNEKHIFPVDYADEIPENLFNQFETIVFLDADAGFTLPNNQVQTRLLSRFNLISQDSVPAIFKVSKFSK